MLKSTICSIVLAIGLGGGLVLAQDVSGSPAETISARRGLMNQLGALQILIEMRLAEPSYSPELYDLSQAAAASLDAFALLLPPQTNLLGGMPAIDGVETTAAAAIWDDLRAFRKLLHESAAAARAASEAPDEASFQAKWEKVAENCAACHQDYVAYDSFASF